LQFIELLDSGIPEFQEDASLNPFLEAVMSRRFGTQVSVLEGVPLAASAQNVENGSGAAAIGDARSSSAEAVSVEAHGNERLKNSPEGVRDAEGGGGWIIASALARAQ
jgi:hypothetical protein